MSSKEIKAGNVKKALVSGIPYILEFVSDTRAKAYTRKKNDKKNKYAGQFNKGPPPIINPNIKEENVKASPTDTKQANIKPTNTKKNNSKAKKTNNTKKVTTVAKRPVKTTKKITPPVSTYTGYFQKQEGLGCGRHALNNLFGREAFKKGVVTDFYVEGTVGEPYSLLGICNTIESVFKKKGMKQSCLSSENYDNNTMIAALDVLGYDHEVIATTTNTILDESGDYVGFLVNQGLIKGKPKHWVALKFKSRDDAGNVYYDYFDSLNPGPIENITYGTFAMQHPQTLMIKVLLPRHATVDPRVRIESLPNAAPPSPKLTKTTVKKKTDCSVLYDPCTMAPLKDLAALEARVAEIKAKQTKV